MNRLDTILITDMQCCENSSWSSCITSELSTENIYSLRAELGITKGTEEIVRVNNQAPLPTFRQIDTAFAFACLFLM